MKSNIKDCLIYIYIILACFFASSSFDGLQDVIHVSVFLAAVAALYLIKNRYIAYGLSAALLICYTVYNIKYALFMLPVFFLIVFHRSCMKKISMAKCKTNKKSEINSVWLHLFILSGTVGAIFAVIRFFESDYQSFVGETDMGVIVAEALIGIFLMGSFSEKVKTKVKNTHKVSNKDYATLNLINFVGVFLFAVTVFCEYAMSQELSIEIYVVCFPWTVWLVVLLYENNPITDAVLALIEEEIKKISEIRIKEK